MGKCKNESVGGNTNEFIISVAIKEYRSTAGSSPMIRFVLAASGTALNPETKEVVAGAVPVNGKVACIICIVICFIIAFTNKREEAK